MKKLFLLFSLLSLVAISCEKPAPEQEKPDVPDAEFVAFATDVRLVSYIDGAYIWDVRIFDKTSFENGGIQTGFSFDFRVSTNEMSSFEKGIPVGEYIIVEELTGTKMSAIGAFVNITTGEAVLMNSGTLEILKSEDSYTFTYNLVDEAGVALEGSLTLTEGDDKLYVINNAYNSTISGDVVTNDYTHATIIKRGDETATGIRSWDVLLGTDGIDFELGGQVTGSGKASKIWITTSMDQESAVGTYSFDILPAENIAEAGTAPEHLGSAPLGSWWFDQTAENVFTDRAPYTKGTLTITKVGEDYTIVVNATDDTVPNTNTIEVNYTGQVEELDVNETGDYFNAEAYYWGPYLKDSPYQNWFVTLGDRAYHETGTGEMLVFDMLTPVADLFTSAHGISDGTYNIVADAAPYSDFTIFEARVDVFEDYLNIESKRIIISSGTVTLKRISETISEIVVDVVDVNGKSYIGTYSGGIAMYASAIEPSKNEVFSDIGGAAVARYDGLDYNPGKSTWAISFYDKESEDTSTDGLHISLEIIADASHTPEMGFPVGTFELFAPNAPLQNGIMNSPGTFYESYFQTSINKQIFSSGSVTIAKDGNNYNVTFDLLNGTAETGFTITGGYKGEIEL